MTREAQPVGEHDLHAYVDGRLDAARRPTVERYLADHPEEAARVEGWRRANEALRQAVAWKAAEPVPPALNVAHIARMRKMRSRERWRMAAGIVLALGIGAGGGWMARAPHTEYGIANVAREAVIAQRVFATDPMHPVEFDATDQAKLVRWASLRLGRPVVPPDLAKSGYTLMGGRIIATEHGPGAMFLYEGSDGARITLFARPMGAIDQNAQMRPVNMDDAAGYVWANDGLGVSLVANHPMSQLHELANHIRSVMTSGA